MLKVAPSGLVGEKDPTLLLEIILSSSKYWACSSFCGSLSKYSPERTNRVFPLFQSVPHMPLKVSSYVPPASCMPLVSAYNSKPSKSVRMIMLTTPATASAPYNAEPPSVRTSTLSVMTSGMEFKFTLS